MNLPALRLDLAEGAIVMLKPDSREIYSAKGERLRRPLIGVQLRYHDQGTIELPAGRVMAADPFSVDRNSKPLARRIPAGSHRVVAVSANVTHGRRRCAFGAVLFDSVTPTRYALALRVGEFIWLVGKNATGGVGTDHGIASIFASRSLPGIIRAPYVELQETIDATLARELGGVAMIPTDGGSTPLAVWNSGFGDGSYTAYWGMVGRRIVSLVIDFDIVANGLRASAVPKAVVGDSMDYEVVGEKHDR